MPTRIQIKTRSYKSMFKADRLRHKTCLREKFLVAEIAIAITIAVLPI